MSWTIAQLLAIPIDEVVIQEPIEGVAKVAMGVKQHEKYGESQFLVIEDGTGEIAVDFKAAGAKTPLPPVEKGDKVRILAQMYKNKLSGAKKETYASNKDGQKKAKITVYGNRLTNLTRSAPPAQTAGAPAATSAAGQLPLAPPTLTEEQAVDLFERVYNRLTGASGDFPLPAEIAARCASTVLSGALAGMLRLDPPATTKTTSPPQQASSQAPSRDEDDDAPPYDDSDIPF